MISFFDLAVLDGKLAKVTPSFRAINFDQQCHESQVNSIDNVFLNWH